MLDNYTIYIDDIDIRSFGIGLQRPAAFSPLVPIVEKVSIPGRNGDLIFDTGAYENRTGTVDCFVLHDRVELNIDTFMGFLMSTHGYRKVQTSEDPNHYWLARITNGVQIEERMRLLNPFTITLDCKPQRWLVDGDDKIDLMLFPIPSDTLYNPYSGEALPIIKGIVGSAVGFTLSVNGLVMTVSPITTLVQSTSIYIDCETKNVYTNSGNANDHFEVTVSGNETTRFPVLKAGENTIAYIDGNYKFSITPRWWDK